MQGRIPIMMQFLKLNFYNKHFIINKDDTSQDNNRNLGTAIKEIRWKLRYNK